MSIPQVVLFCTLLANAALKFFGTGASKRSVVAFPRKEKARQAFSRTHGTKTTRHDFQFPVAIELTTFHIQAMRTRSHAMHGKASPSCAKL